jgi:8-oxo-dGTP pyrophosphatase MutT (NUDIX family)
MDVLSPIATIEAAGGVVWRGAWSRRQIALVHRPRYDDWSLPKGKLKRDEPSLVGACREVWEETGIRVRAGARLPAQRYPTAVRGQVARKTVRYWSMAVVDDEGFRPGPETDAIEWLSITAALRRMSYPRDARVLEAFAGLPALRPPLILVRPTTEDLTPLLRCFAPTALLAADHPGAAALGASLGLTVTGLPTPTALRRLSGPAVVWAPGTILTAAIAELTGLARAPRGGRGWVLSLPARAGNPAIVDPLG